MIAGDYFKTKSKIFKPPLRLEFKKSNTVFIEKMHVYQNEPGNPWTKNLIVLITKNPEGTR
jgi:hypothetical protein